MHTPEKPIIGALKTPVTVSKVKSFKWNQQQRDLVVYITKTVLEYQMISSKNNKKPWTTIKGCLNSLFNPWLHYSMHGRYMMCTG